MKNVLWISRHQMTPDQEKDLQRILGQRYHLLQYTETVRRIEQILPELQWADVICAVLPPELCSQVLTAVPGKPLLRAVSGRVPTSRMFTTADGRREQEFAFVHRGWEQILRLEIETQMLNGSDAEKLFCQP